MKKIKVLIVDDSLVFRELLSKKLSADPIIEVVATAVDPFDARDKIIAYRPDVMTLDVEMPKMNGIEFLRKLMPQYPLPTIVISAVNECVFEAIQYGAVDFIKKPDGRLLAANQEFFNELLFKVKTAVHAKIKVDAGTHPVHVQKHKHKQKLALSEQLIAIGASTGGTVALMDVLMDLEPELPLPGIVIVQHIPPVFSTMFSKRLDSVMKFKVSEAQTGDVVMPGKVFIAPGDQHMVVKKIGTKYKIECFKSERVNGHCPSVDVLFNSVAEFGSAGIGVILTGMGYDGAKGLLKMRKAGARTIGQDEKSCVVYGMPKVAYNIGAVETQLPLDKIAAKICSLV